MAGILNAVKIAADIPIASSIAPVTTGLSIPIAAGETINFRYFVPFSLGATGGVRAIVAVPAAGTQFTCAITLFNPVTPALITALQVANAAFTNALAVAGNHWIALEGVVVNGANAGNVDLQMAQNTSDVLTLTILRGGYAVFVKA